MPPPPPTRVRVQSRLPLPPFRAWLPYTPNEQFRFFRRRLFNHLPESIAIAEYTVQLADFHLLDHVLCSIIDPVNDILELVADEVDQDDDDDDDDQCNGNSDKEVLMYDSDEASDDAAISDNEAKVKALPQPRMHASVPGSRSGKPVQPPSGSGLARTKARNARKRKKRRLEKQAVATVVSHTSSPATIPVAVGSQQNVAGAVSHGQQLSSPSSSSSSASSSSSSLSSSSSSSDTEESDTEESDDSGPDELLNASLIGPVQPPSPIETKKRKRSQINGKAFNMATTLTRQRQLSPHYTPQSPRLSFSPMTKSLPPSPHFTKPTCCAPPPSYRPQHSVPHNIFITGIDVESKDWKAGMIGWNGVLPPKNRGKWKKKKKQLKKWNAYSDHSLTSFQQENVVAPWALNHADDEEHILHAKKAVVDPQAEDDDEAAYLVEHMLHDSKEEEEKVVVDRHGVDWSKHPDPNAVDQWWLISEPVDKFALHVGQNVLVRYLEIVTSSFTPELQTVVARVKSHTPDFVTLHLHPFHIREEQSTYNYDNDESFASVNHRQQLKESRRALFEESRESDVDGREWKTLSLVDVREVRQLCIQSA